MTREKPVVRKRREALDADAANEALLSVQRCVLCGSDRGPFEVVFDGRRQVSVCTACSSERE